VLPRARRAAKALTFFQDALKAPGLTLAASKEAHFEIGHCFELLGAEHDALDQLCPGSQGRPGLPRHEGAGWNG